ncbi:MAG: helix-turn-helix domain-containing protein [Pseudomonadota bacterium]
MTTREAQRREWQSEQDKRAHYHQKAHHPRSIAAFAERYGISRATVYNLIARGELNVTKAGRRTVITESQEQEWLARSEKGTAK